jgi:hypothetical protein
MREKRLLTAPTHTGRAILAAASWRSVGRAEAHAMAEAEKEIVIHYLFAIHHYTLNAMIARRM